MKDKFGAITLVSFLIAIMGVVVPIAWDYYSGKKGVSLTLMSHTQVISANSGVEGVEISYKGMKLSSLSRMTFLVENTGNKPILESDIVSPVKIVVSEETKVLDVIVDSKVPENLDFLASKEGRNVLIKFSLLNPGDKAFVSLLVNSVEKNFSAVARIAGVQDLIVNHEPPKTLTIWALVWIPVGILSLVLLLASFVGFSQYPQEAKVKKSLKSGQFTVPDFDSYEEAHEWVKNTTDFITSSDRAPIFDVLKEQEESGFGFDKERISNAVNTAVLNSSNNLIMALVVSCTGIFGFYYALRSMGYI